MTLANSGSCEACHNFLISGLPLSFEEDRNTARIFRHILFDTNEERNWNMALLPKPVGKTAGTSFPLRRVLMAATCSGFRLIDFPLCEKPLAVSCRANSKRITFDYGHNWSDLSSGIVVIIALNLLTSCWHWSFSIDQSLCLIVSHSWTNSVR